MYKLVKILGRGSFGQVFLAHKFNDNKNIALKRISIYRLSHRDKQNLIDEIRILCFCNCPYIIRFIDCQYGGSHIDIITNYVKRGDLCKIIQKRSRKFDESTVWSYFIQCCLGVKYLHKNKIIHRDIKSSNVLVNSADHVYLTDFGASKVFLRDNTLTNTQIGTPLYISPEMISKKDYSFSIDIWGIGCLLFETITFSPPFLAKNMINLSNKILTTSFSRNLMIYKDKYSLILLNLVDKILVKDEIKRLTIEQIMVLPEFKEHIYLIPYETRKNIDIKNKHHLFRNLSGKRWQDILKCIMHS
jgi:serine/threonine protein kinase